MRSTLDADLRIVTKGEEDAGVKAAWEYLFGQVEKAGAAPHVKPLARPVGAEKPRHIRVCDLATELDKTAAPVRFLALALCEGAAVEAVPLADGDGRAGQVARALFPRAQRGALQVFPGAARFSFHLILRWYAARWCEMGFTIHPVVAGANIKALRVTKGRDVWWLCDFQSLTGDANVEAIGADRLEAAMAGRVVGDLRGLHSRLSRLVELSNGRFQVGLRPTLAGTAFAAFSRALPPEVLKFRPPQLLEAMLRVGRGYRGGYVYARRHRGTVWQYDLTRAYTWALGEPLPERWAFGRWEGVSRDDGVWMCRVEARGDLPVYVSRFNPGLGRFDASALTNGGSFVAVLVGAELEGMRRLGYHVWPKWGFEPLFTFRVPRFVDKLSTIYAEYGRESWQDNWGKLIGNVVYGKLAARPDRERVCYAAECPPNGWYPYVTTEGEVIDGLWAKPEVEYSPSQQVDWAAVVTGRVRGRLYAGMAAALASGARVVAADTDGFVATKDVGRALGGVGSEFGSWREVHQQAPGVIVRRRLAQIGERTIAAGISGATPIAVEAAFHGEQIQVGGKVLHLPWLRGQGSPP